MVRNMESIIELEGHHGTKHCDQVSQNSDKKILDLESRHCFKW